jgi:hypothetical protein
MPTIILYLCISSWIPIRIKQYKSAQNRNHQFGISKTRKQVVNIAVVIPQHTSHQWCKSNLLAPIRLRPVPPALADSKKTNTSPNPLFSWSTSACRKPASVDPSRRRYFQPWFVHIACRTIQSKPLICCKLKLYLSVATYSDKIPSKRFHVG